MKRFLIVLCVLTVLILAVALPVFAADDPTQPADRHYNHFSVDIVDTYSMLDTWVNAKPGRAVSFQRDTNTITITYAPGDEGTTITSSSVPIDEFMPFFLAGDKYVYYAGGGGNFEDGGGFTLFFNSMESGGNTPQPRAYELSYINSAQNTAGNATVYFTIKIPSDAVGGVYSIPYIGIYRVNDLNRSHFQFFEYGTSGFGTGSTDVAQGIFVPFNLNSLIDYERDRGYASGYYFGQQKGYADGKEDGIEIGDQQGYTRGKAEGAAEGEIVGYDKGYAQGVADGGDYTFLNLMNSVVSVPVQALRSLLNFEIFGYNMLNFFGSVVTLMIGLWVLKTFVL